MQKTYTTLNIADIIDESKVDISANLLSRLCVGYRTNEYVPPISVIRTDNGWLLIDGRCRLNASILLGRKTINATIEAFPPPPPLRRYSHAICMFCNISWGRADGDEKSACWRCRDANIYVRIYNLSPQTKDVFWEQYFTHVVLLQLETTHGQEIGLRDESVFGLLTIPETDKFIFWKSYFSFIVLPTFRWKEGCTSCFTHDDEVVYIHPKRHTQDFQGGSHLDELFNFRGFVCHDCCKE